MASSSSDTLPLDAPLLPPLVLRPPLGPRVVRGLVMLLAFILIGLTAGWSVILDGREGELAGTARMMLVGGEPVEAVSPSGPLAAWLCKGSMNLFGVNELAARLPSAAAALAAIWLVLRLGERFGGTWRGLVTGMLLLCTPGMFTLGRTLSPAPLEMAFLAAVFHALHCAYEERRGRRHWFLTFWIFLAGAWFAGGWTPVAIVLLSVAVLLGCYRTARMRFRGLLSWEGAVVVAVAAVLTEACDFRAVPSGLNATSLSQALGWQGVLLFPWSLLLIPAALRLGRRLMMRTPLEWEEALPLVWLLCGVVVIALSPTRSLFDTVMLWPAFALWGARALEITSRRALLRGIGVVLGLGLVGLLMVGSLRKLFARFFPAVSDAMAGIPHFFWPSVTSVFLMALLAFVLGLAAVFVLELYHHRRFAMVGLFGAMIPLGYACADISSKAAPYFSHAEIARCISEQGWHSPPIFIDGSRYQVSSLYFYLDSGLLPLRRVGDPFPKEERAFLVTRQGRLAHWEQRSRPAHLRVECESGRAVLLSRVATPAATDRR